MQIRPALDASSSVYFASPHMHIGFRRHSLTRRQRLHNDEEAKAQDPVVAGNAGVGEKTIAGSPQNVTAGLLNRKLACPQAGPHRPLMICHVRVMFFA